MTIEERQFPAKVIPGTVVQEFDPVTGIFVRQYFVQQGKLEYQAADGCTTGRDAFLNIEGDEYILPPNMLQPEPEPEPISNIIELGNESIVIDEGKIITSGILEPEDQIAKYEPLEQMKAQLCNSSMEGMLTLIQQMVKHGISLQAMKAAIVESLDLIGDFYE